jgi:hypothetical protein
MPWALFGLVATSDIGQSECFRPLQTIYLVKSISYCVTQIPQAGKTAPASDPYFLNPDNLGCLQGAARGHHADRRPALGIEDVGKDVGDPLDFERAATPVAVSRITLAVQSKQPRETPDG